MSIKKHTLNSEKWVDLHADYLFNYTISRINNYDLAKDLVQDTFFAGLKIDSISLSNGQTHVSSLR